MLGFIYSAQGYNNVECMSLNGKRSRSDGYYSRMNGKVEIEVKRTSKTPSMAAEKCVLQSTIIHLG
jgi:hypothetical protein